MIFGYSSFFIFGSRIPVFIGHFFKYHLVKIKFFWGQTFFLAFYCIDSVGSRVICWSDNFWLWGLTLMFNWWYNWFVNDIDNNYVIHHLVLSGLSNIENWKHWSVWEAGLANDVERFLETEKNKAKPSEKNKSVWKTTTHRKYFVQRYNIYLFLASMMKMKCLSGNWYNLYPSPVRDWDLAPGTITTTTSCPNHTWDMQYQCIISWSYSGIGTGITTPATWGPSL